MSGFLGFPEHFPHGRLPKAVMFGAGHGSTYPGKTSSAFALAPDLIRAASQEDAELVEHWDFDLGGPLFNGYPNSCIDLGNLGTTMEDNEGNRAQIERKTREILALPALPILLGGDDSTPIPFLAGFTDHGPIWVLQIDAHIDWRDELGGERSGYSSPMRRASEMPHVAGIVQVGMRGVGSARLGELEAAAVYGSGTVTARQVHSQGVEAALRRIPKGANVVITLDCDGLNPSIMPGVIAPSPGGLTYTQVIDIIAGVGNRARIAGFDVVEFYPPADLGSLTALTAARFLVNVIGQVARP
ncbi:arginase family protein [Shinella sp.]|uniref:arginase family protein n=1 Tax=Shinella sp. TaxID=1870904 RepID=UPI0028AFD431|nr:arginase family protein [Shinella sp.]